MDHLNDVHTRCTGLTAYQLSDFYLTGRFSWSCSYAQKHYGHELWGELPSCSDLSRYSLWIVCGARVYEPDAVALEVNVTEVVGRLFQGNGVTNAY